MRFLLAWACVSVYNDGLAGARCIKTLIDERPLSECRFIPQDNIKEIQKIEATSNISYLLNWSDAIPSAHQKRLNVKITGRTT
jgi:hypothetical protein